MLEYFVEIPALKALSKIPMTIIAKLNRHLYNFREPLDLNSEYYAMRTAIVQAGMCIFLRLG